MAVRDHDGILGRLALLLASLDPNEPLTSRLCEAGRILLGGHGAALTIDYTAEQRVTLCATDDVAARIEDLQDVLGEGPGRDAYVSGAVVTADIPPQATGDWQLLASMADEVDFAVTAWSLPMRPGREVLGVLTLYRTDGQLAEDLETAQFLADAIGAALLDDPKVNAVDAEVAGSWASRSQIHQATGMVIAQLSISPQDALALLRAQAYARSIDMATVAKDTVERRINFADYKVSGD